MALTILLGGWVLRTEATTPPEVATVTIEPRPVELSTELPGRTSAYLVAEIRPQVNGIIKKRLFQEGSDVKAGQLLYQIDPAPFQVAHDSAKASLGKAEANLPSIRLRAERHKELLVDKAVSRQDYDDAAAAMGQARAEIGGRRRLKGPGSIWATPGSPPPYPGASASPASRWGPW
jgi:membrane fusion protein (multidrug efflux system)